MFGIKKILKDWALVISMLFGIVSYIIYIKIPVFRPLDYIANESVSIIQPLLIFSMLFLTFTRVKPTDLKPHRWQMWIAFIQMFFFVAFTLILWLYPNASMRFFI